MALVLNKLTIHGKDHDAHEALDHLTALSKDPRTAKWGEPIRLLLEHFHLRRTTPLTAFTSGTTGTPSKIKISRRDLVASAKLTALTFSLKPKDKVLLCLPCEFIAGKMMVIRAMVSGLDLYLTDPRGAVLSALKSKERFRFTAMVPLQLHRAIQDDRTRVEAQFETILLGGGPVSAALLEDIKDLRTEVFQSYGSTETVTHVAVRALNNAAIADQPNDFAPLGPDAFFRAIGKCSFSIDPRGCLVVYTPHLSVKQHVTNDLVEFIDDFRFRWLGRWDNVILSGGKKIFPEQLEARTAGLLPYAHYFTSTPDDTLGQAVMLVIEADEDADNILPGIMDQLVHVLDAHELPRRVRAFRTFDRTISGKVIRLEEPA